jgi:NAD-dependent DNA ligase
MNRDELDAHGQPRLQGFHYSRLIGRSADELIGLCKGVLADGEVNRSEAVFLLEWMQANSQYIRQWPFDRLYARLASALMDDRIDEDEERELLALLVQLASPTLGPSGESAPNEMLCDDPVPAIHFESRVFCLTGKFASGTRSQIEALVEGRGGRCASAVTKKVNYLVIGSMGSRDWLMSTHGTKINGAADLRNAGHPISVIAERHFIPCLERSG